MHSEYHHLFIAVEIDLKLVERLTLVQEDLGKIIEARGAAVRWTSPENMHLTLKFLGSHDAALIPELGKYIDDAVKGFAPFSMNTAFLGAFPSPDCPRVLYASTDQGVEKLLQLRTRLEEVLAMYQFAPEARVFMPHITLGRIKTQDKKLHFGDAINALKDLNFGASNIYELVLFGSTFSSRGAQYTVLSRHPLSAKSRGSNA